MTRPAVPAEQAAIETIRRSMLICDGHVGDCPVCASHAALDSLASRNQQLEQALDHAVDEAVDRWHGAVTASPLAEWLGLTTEQYAVFVKDGYVAALAGAAGSQDS